jgi:hypothetical protein
MRGGWSHTVVEANTCNGAVQITPHASQVATRRAVSKKQAEIVMLQALR